MMRAGVARVAGAVVRVLCGAAVGWVVGAGLGANRDAGTFGAVLGAAFVVLWRDGEGPA